MFFNIQHYPDQRNACQNPGKDSHQSLAAMQSPLASMPMKAPIPIPIIKPQKKGGI